MQNNDVKLQSGKTRNFAEETESRKETEEQKLLNLDPKCQTKQDNIFMDFMALYSRASINDRMRYSNTGGQMQLQAMERKNEQ